MSISEHEALLKELASLQSQINDVDNSIEASTLLVSQNNTTINNIEDEIKDLNIVLWFI